VQEYMRPGKVLGYSVQEQYRRIVTEVVKKCLGIAVVQGYSNSSRVQMYRSSPGLLR